jgi:hypothetical protein
MTDWKSWAKKWTPDQRYAIERYQAGGYAPINRTLRGMATDESQVQVSDYGPEPVQHYIDQIDTVIRSAPPLTNAVTVYRRVYYDPKERGADDKTFYNALGRPGTQIIDRGFTSTAAERLQRTEPSTGPGAFRERALEIHVPAGTRAPYIGEFGNPAFKDEREVLLPRGGTFIVRSAPDAHHSVLDYIPPTTMGQ